MAMFLAALLLFCFLIQVVIARFKELSEPKYPLTFVFGVSIVSFVSMLGLFYKLR